MVKTPPVIASLLLLAVPAGARTVTLYEHIDFKGESVTFSAPVAAVGRSWNDRASSVRIEGGAWELCRHKGFTDCRVIVADLADLRATGWNDAISSLRPADAPGSSPEAASPASERGARGRDDRAPASAAALAGRSEEVKGYLEYRRDDALIVEGQRLVTTAATKFRGSDQAKSPATIPPGYQVEAKGVRRADGAIEARNLEAKRNGSQLFETDVMQATDQLEATWRAKGELLTAAPDGKTQSMGKLRESGPEVDRARRVVDRLLPPYIPQSAVRVYVVDNPEWNAMAMGNFSIYVFSGIMGDLDDDELALVVGHEIAHASHEHTRKQQKRGILTGLAAVGAAVVADQVLDGGEAKAAGILAGLGAVVFANGYSRDQEDQADRVGMRYAYEGGFDVRKGPRLWQRFADKYGEPGKTQNILFGDHSRSSVRAVALEREIALNYSPR